jgi:hypothetical protein
VIGQVLDGLQAQSVAGHPVHHQGGW